MSATIPSMDFYNPGLCKGLEFYDNSNKKDANLTEADIQETINSIKEKVDDFSLKILKELLFFCHIWAAGYRKSSEVMSLK